MFTFKQNSLKMLNKTDHNLKVINPLLRIYSSEIILNYEDWQLFLLIYL